MNDKQAIDRITLALKKVPKQDLLIIELANRVCGEDGQLDFDELERLQPEVNLAIAEAKMYGAHTMMAVEALRRLLAGKEGQDVGP